jgi:hypothetical protein
VPRGFRYQDPNAEAVVRKVVVRPDKLIVRGGGSGWGYTLNEDAQGSVALRLRLGSGPTWCAEGGRSPFPAIVDQQDRFAANPQTPAPALCPTVP